jgi:hypothetical protein
MLPLFLSERRRFAHHPPRALSDRRQTFDSENLTPLSESCRAAVYNGMPKILITQNIVIRGDFYEIYALDCHVKKSFQGDAHLPKWQVGVI